MATYVLVHGAWRGSWAWKRVRDLLIAQGHHVFTPTLTGMADRKHLLAPHIGLETHVDDVANLILYEELNDIVLVGHSYGGAVAQHVADRLAPRIASLVYVDAFLLEDGKSVLHYLPNDGAAHRENARAHGGSWIVPPVPAAATGVNAADVAWVDRQLTPISLRSLDTPARLTGACDTIRNIGYIRATGHARTYFEQFYQFAESRGWWLRQMTCGHDVAIDMPQELATLLMEQAPKG